MIEEVPYHTHNGIDSPRLAAASSSATALTVVPKSVAPADPAVGNAIAGNDPPSNTRAYVGQVIVPFAITANKFTVRLINYDGGTNVKFALYSEDGQSQVFATSIETTNPGAGEPKSATLSSVSIDPGIYYIAFVGQASDPATQIAVWGTDNDSGTTQLLSGTTSEPVIEGYLTVSAYTLPTTFDPVSDITFQTNSTAYFRLDN